MLKKILPILILLLHLNASAQRHQGLNSNRYMSLYGAVGYPYQSAGISFPVNKSGINIQAHFNTDLGGIATELANPDNQFIGVTKSVTIGRRTDMRVGVAANTRLHTSSSDFSVSPMINVEHHLTPWFSIGGTYLQPTRAGVEWTSTLPIIQAAGFIDLHWHKRTRGLRLFRHQKQYTLWMNALSGIYYNTVGLEYAVSNNDGFAVRAQVFTDYGTFLDHEPLPNFQWLGGIYKYSFREVVLKAGAGLGVKDIASDIAAAPYFMVSGQQLIIPRTYLLVEIWQPTMMSFSQRMAPLIQVGFTVEFLH